MEIEEEYRSRQPEDQASFSEAGAVAYDAVWALALGLNKSLSNVDHGCISRAAERESKVDGWEELRECIGCVERDVQNNEFRGITVC